MTILLFPQDLSLVLTPFLGQPFESLSAVAHTFLHGHFFQLAEIQRLSAVQPHSQLGELFGLIPKFLQWCQNSIQMKKLTSALFSDLPNSVAEPSLDSEHQEDHFLLVCYVP